MATPNWSTTHPQSTTKLDVLGSWFSAKVGIVWNVIQAYLENPLYQSSGIE